MQVSVETLGALERRIRVVVPSERLTEALEKRIVEIAKKIKMDGFRPGKVPLPLVRARYTESARQEALGDLVQASITEAIIQEKLTPASTPAVEPLSVTTEGPIEFVATFEVVPDITSIRFEPDTLEKENVVITETDIDLTLDRVRKQQVTWKSVSRAAANGDRVTLDFLGKLEGVAFPGGEAHDYPLVLGDGRMVPGFEEGIVGMMPGEDKVINVTFPEEYFSKDLAGKVVTFDLKLKTVSEPALPEMDADFVKKLGVESGELSDLRAEISRNLSRGVQQAVQNRLKSKVFALLIEQNQQEVPKSFVEREKQRLHQQSHQHTAHGHEKDTCQHSAEDLEQLAKVAKDNVLLSLLLSGLIRKHQLTVESERLQAYLGEVAAAYEDPTEVIRWYNSNNKALDELRMQLLEEKVIEKLLEGIQLAEKSLSYTELQEKAS